MAADHHVQPVHHLVEHRIERFSALEIAWTRVVTETGTREGTIVAPFLTQGYEGFNVDDEEDWERAERLVEAGIGVLARVRRNAFVTSSEGNAR